MKEIEPGLYQIESEAELEALAGAAVEKMNECRQRFDREYLTPKRCRLIRQLRVEEGLSWRCIAARCCVEFDGDWFPTDNQLVGMTLCEVAAQWHGENYMEAPWN